MASAAVHSEAVVLLLFILCFLLLPLFVWLGGGCVRSLFYYAVQFCNHPAGGEIWLLYCYCFLDATVFYLILTAPWVAPWHFKVNSHLLFFYHGVLTIALSIFIISSEDRPIGYDIASRNSILYRIRSVHYSKLCL